MKPLVLKSWQYTAGSFSDKKFPKFPIDKHNWLCKNTCTPQWIGIKMNCPYCGYPDSRVIDSRDVNAGIRRRRQCLSCKARFTTYERLQPASLFVVKKDQRREEYNREKLLSGIRKACEKRPLPTGAIEKLVDEIESELYDLGKAEVPSSLIGDKVMEKLKTLDHIAYIRFASVYREFADITALKEAVDNLIVNQKEKSYLAGQLTLIPDNQVLKTEQKPNKKPNSRIKPAGDF
ncbi:MAG: transcriptional regulator NrdR [Dehalococcoidales bacterium]|nr:transcriptional regulator NrdR [Dehalococcoidales bacterium]